MGSATRTFVVDVPAGPSPHIERALAETVPLLIRDAWIKVSGDGVDTGDYRAHLFAEDALRYPFSGDPDACAVVNTSAHVSFVDEGRAGFHLPSRWGSGRGRWKVGATGNLYAYVPFESTTPSRGARVSASRRRSMMPSAVHRLAKKLGHGERLVGFGQMYAMGKSYTVMRRMYANFSSTFRDAAMADLAGYDWVASRYEGLFQSGLSRTPGGGTQSKYMTIRTITPDSPGWFIPPTEGKHYGDRALDLAAPAITAVLDAAGAADMELAILGAAKEMI